MKDMAYSNTQWMVRVRHLMERGLGYDDIAVMLKCTPEQVRQEADILRQEGLLVEIYREWRRKCQARR